MKYIMAILLLIMATTVNAQVMMSVDAVKLEAGDKDARLAVGCLNNGSLVVIIENEKHNTQQVKITSFGTNVYAAGITKTFLNPRNGSVGLEGEDAKEYAMAIIREATSKKEVFASWHLSTGQSFNISEAASKFAYVLGYCDGKK